MIKNKQKFRKIECNEDLERLIGLIENLETPMFAQGKLTAHT